MIGTIEYRLAGKTRPAANTTPESLDVMRFAAELERLGGTHLISEVSSHALALGRVYGFHFHTAVFTNLTRDHLDFHGTMEEYAAAKRLLFVARGRPGSGMGGAESPTILGPHRSNPPRTPLFYGIGPSERMRTALRAENIRSGLDGLRFDLCWEGARQPIESALAGRINVLNILAAAGAGFELRRSVSRPSRAASRPAAPFPAVSSASMPVSRFS